MLFSECLTVEKWVVCGGCPSVECRPALGFERAFCVTECLTEAENAWGGGVPLIDLQKNTGGGGGRVAR